jgi:amino acid adenylation domain-containing protein
VIPSGPGPTSSSWEGFRLSRQQEHVLGVLSSGHAGRLVAGVLLADAVELDVLERALHDVVSVHEILRTVYRRVLGEDSTVLMVIEDDPRIRLSTASGDEAALAAIVRGAREFAIGQDDCALNLIVFTHADQRQSLVLSAPRMSVDGVSAEIFFRDLQHAYAARRNGSPWSRDDVTQYADYAEWQFDEAERAEQNRERPGGSQTLPTALPPLRLPLELPSGSTEHEVLEWTVPAPLARKLRALDDQYAGGLHGVLLTGWLTALWHAAGRPCSLAVETVVPGRAFPELATTVGCFESPAPIVADIADATTLAEVLTLVGKSLASLEAADGGSAEPAGPQAAPLPGFTFRGGAGLEPVGLPAFRDLWIEPSDDLRKVGLRARATDDEIRLALYSQRGGMAEGGVEALMACLRAVVAALGDDCSVAAGSLAMLDEDAAREHIAAANTAQPPDQLPVHWHRQVEQRARRTPDRTALVTESRSWTYRELDETANRLAHELRARGTGTGDLVGLCLERSDVAIVAMLAIAKAGSGYVPVDPRLPARRRAAITAAAGFRRAVATVETAADLPADCDRVLVDPSLSAYTQLSGERPDVTTADDDPAYVLFTSGSTGVPKGVQVGHGQLAAYLDGVMDRLGLAGAIDSVAFSSLGTDLGNTALFPPLLTGGRLTVVAADVSTDAQALADVLTGETFDLVKITPKHLEALLAVAEDPRKLIPRKALVLGGESLSWDTYHLLRGFLDGCEVFNHYGPSETTVGVLCGRVADDGLATLTSTVPLGAPMQHARAYVLDPQRRPLPPGIPGELWIGGSSVSQGYLPGTAEEEQQRFTDDPFSQAPGARMYRTGDKARLLPGGRYEFLGRIDRQIKVRGFRVELSEIEAVMRRHPRVTGALVVVSGENVNEHLVGYLTDAEGGRGAVDWIGGFLAEHLPDFMIPTQFTALDAFPLTSTGKIDEAMLSERSVYDADPESFVAPRTKTEARVAEVMARLLLLEVMGADSDFFESGGHSLVATQLVVELREEFGVAVKLRHLFERPVVSELASLIDHLLEEKAGEEC